MALYFHIPFPEENPFLQLMAIRAPLVFQGVKWSYAVFLFSTPYIVYSILLSGLYVFALKAHRKIRAGRLPGTSCQRQRYAPQVVVRPRWLTAYARTLRPPDLTVPNMVPAGQPAPTFFGAYAQWAATPPPAWDDVAWLAQLWGGPFLVKGITRIDDAKRAVDAGATAVSVSNHGGNNLDGTPASIRALPGVADAVGGQIEVLLDGGIRRGSDVVKALALGARAVMIGRAYLWGLAANGSAGVKNVFDVLRGGIDSTLLALGRSSIGELSPDDIIMPAEFSRGLHK